MKNTIKRLIAVVCALALLFTLFTGIPVSAAAENLALDCPAVATYEQMGTEDYNAYATNAFDGDLYSRWSTFGGGDELSMPASIQVDLKAECELDRLVFYWFGNGRTFTYNVYVTDEPMIVGNIFEKNAEPAASGLKGQGSGDGNVGSSGSLTTENLPPASTFKGRYLTVEVTDVQGGARAAVLWELEVYGIRKGENVKTEINEVYGFTERYVPFGTEKSELALPDAAEASLSNYTSVKLPVEWQCDEYKPNVPGSYVFKGTPKTDDKILNPNGLCATMTITVLEEDAELLGRRVYSICNDWKFKKGAVLGAQNVDFNDSTWGKISVPHTWNALDGQDGGNNYFRGDGWYRRTIDWNDAYSGKQIFIEFLGANMQADVYVNGQRIGTHKGGYTAFRYDITDALIPGKDNQLAVKVNNSRTEDIAPLSGDFTFFGGIYREVSLIVTDPVHADALDYASSGLKLTTSDVSEKKAMLKIQSTIKNEAAEEKTLTVTAVLKHPDSFEEIEGFTPEFDVSKMYGGGTVKEVSEEITIPAGGSYDFAKTVLVSNPHLWNGKKDPYRYQVDLTVKEGGKTLDNLTQFVGFRYFNVDYDNGFFLNGKSYPLRGVSRHQDREDMGNALTEKEHNEDFALIYEMGVNSIRLAHYPQAPYFYELCDKYGIVVWAEIPFVNNVGGSGSYKNPDANRKSFFNITKQQLTELIRQQYNRPSICFWGLQNEVLEYSECMPEFMAELNDLAHAEDPSRLTTQATDKPAALDWPSDIIAWNRYPGWYFGVKEDIGSDFDSKHEAEKRPIGISEHGAGSNTEQHVEIADDSDKSLGGFQPEEYQNICHETYIKKINERPYLWATYVWNMFDFSSDPRNEGGLPGVNTKGLVTRDRTVKKDSYYLYKANWSDAPFVYLASRRNDLRENALVQIKAYSNCESVELKVNGIAVGTLKQSDLKQETVFVWDDVQLKSGSNEIELTSTQDGKTYTDKVTWEKAVGTGTDISSNELEVDTAAKTVSLTKVVKADELAGMIYSKSGACFKAYAADGETEVTAGKIKPGMILRVTSEDGANSVDYTFVSANLAVGKTVTASSFETYNDQGAEAYHPAEYAVDGDAGTRWAASSATYPQWICIDLGESRDLDRIAVSWYLPYDTRAYKYIVSVSDQPDSGFKVAVDRSNNALPGVLSDSLKGFSGRYVKIEVVGSNGGSASIYEIKIYENVPDIPDPVLKGDMDKNGVLDVNDLTALKASVMAGDGDADTLARGDMDLNGAIDVNDMSALKKTIMDQK